MAIFSLESILGSSCHGFAYSAWLSDKTVRKFAELFIGPVMSAACSPETLVSGDISFMPLFTGFM